ncbi:MAG: LysR family transcriptional regulator [Rhodospirillales bacterium]|nr:LysR family transcriptional regulator [Rhodospirillales bacterium]
MDVRDLFYFQTIAECEHMGRAAERLFLTQPALTKAVRRLEEQIGAPLFARMGRRIALTELGHILLKRTYRLRQIMDDTAREVKSYADGQFGHIRLGCAPTMVKFLLPDIMPDLLRQAPGVTMELHSSVSGDLLALLREGLLDLVLTHVSAPIERYEVVPLVRDDIVVVARKHHPIFDGPYTVRDLARYNWVLPRSSATRPWLNAALAKQNCPPPQAQLEATSILYLPRLIAGTELLSLLSRRNLSGLEDGDLLREVALPETTLHRVFCLVYGKNSYLSPAAQRLVDLLVAKSDAELLSLGE